VTLVYGVRDMKDYCFYRDTIVECIESLPNGRVLFASSRQETSEDCGVKLSQKVKQIKGYAQDWLPQADILDYVK